MLKAGLLQAVLVVAMAMSVSAFSVQAAEQTINNDQVLAKIKQARPKLQFGAVEQSPMAGIYQVQVVDGPVLYFHPSGNYFVAGELFEVASSGIVNLTEMAQNAPRKALMATVDPKDMIIFSAEGETKTTITVFTDVSCGYCREFHKGVPALNKSGVTVQYMAFTGAESGTRQFRKMAAAWCARDRQEAMNKLKALKDLEEINNCADNPIVEQYRLGKELGVKATPTLILEDGSLVEGYMPVDQLLQRLGLR
jgi:thiol:disulfide interchange protein DsbC